MGKNLDKFENIHIEYLKINQQECNETFRGLNIQLILFAATILSFSLLIFLNKDITTQLYLKDKMLLIITWIVLGLSVLLGIVQFWVTYNFFKEHTSLHSFLVDKLNNDNEIKKIKEELNILSEEEEKKMNEIYDGIVDKLIYEKAKEMALKSFPNILPESSEKYIKWQTFLIIFSMGLLIYFMAKVLLQF